MDWQEASNDWNQLRDKARSHWFKLKYGDLPYSKTSQSYLVQKLVKRYHWSPQQANQEIDSFLVDFIPPEQQSGIFPGLF